MSGIEWLERDGSGPAIVLLHGIGSNAGSFIPLQGFLPQSARLLAWNAPGYGASRALVPRWPSAKDYARVLLDWLDAAGLERVILVGHSLGTLIAAAFARAHPGRVAHLVLAASACGYGVAPGTALPEKVAARIADLAALGPRDFARTRAPRLVHDPDANPDLVRHVETAMAAVNPAGYAQAVHMLASGDLEETLRGVTVSTGFIIGAEDVVTPRAQTDRAARARGGDVPVHVIADAGHAVYLQQPAAFAVALSRIIATPETGEHHA